MNEYLNSILGKKLYKQDQTELSRKITHYFMPELTDDELDFYSVIPKKNIYVLLKNTFKLNVEISETLEDEYGKYYVIEKVKHKQ